MDFGFWIVVVSVLFVAAPNAAVWILHFGFWERFGFCIRLSLLHADSGRWINQCLSLGGGAPFQYIPGIVQVGWMNRGWSCEKQKRRVVAVGRREKRLGNMTKTSIAKSETDFLAKHRDTWDLRSLDDPFPKNGKGKASFLVELSC